MIRIFSHYVSRKLVFLVGLDALVLMLSAYVGISLHLYATVGALPSAEAALPPQAAAFALWVLVVMTSTGLYQLQPSESVRSVLGRLVTAVLFGFAVTFLVSYVLPSLHMGSDALVIAVIVALTGSILVRFAFFKWGNISAFKPRVLVLGTGSRVMKLAEFAQRNQNHVVVGYLALQPSKHFVPLPRVLPMEPGESLLSVVEKYRIDQIVIGVRDRRDGGLPLQQLLECRLRGVTIT